MERRLSPRDVSTGEHVIEGRAELRRVGRWRFPVYEVVCGGAVLATVGRLGWMRIFLGRGVRVDLSDGVRWRIRSATIRGRVCPVIVDIERRRVAMAEQGIGNYGLTGRDYGYAVNPGHAPRRARSVWTVRHYEDLVGEVCRRPLSFEARQPVHLGAVLMSFVLMRYGLPGDMAPTLPRFRWR